MSFEMLENEFDGAVIKVVGVGGAGGTAARLQAHQAAARWCRPPARLLLDSHYRAQRPGLHL